MTDAKRVPREPTQEWSDAALEIVAERGRQITKEGWTPEHDDFEHASGDLAMAAASYATHGYCPDVSNEIWPFDRRWFKPTNNRRNLIKAGALILAEIDRLDRAAPAAEPPADDLVARLRWYAADLPQQIHVDMRAAADHIEALNLQVTACIGAISSQVTAC